MQVLSTFNTSLGSGPRHVVFGGKNQDSNSNFENQDPIAPVVYILHEMGNYLTVGTIVKNQNQNQNQQTNEYSLINHQQISTLQQPAVFRGYTKAAEILITADRKFVLASNRGYGPEGGTVAVFKVSETDGTGSLERVDTIEIGDKYPRGMTLIEHQGLPSLLLVAGQSTGKLFTYELHHNTHEVMTDQEEEVVESVRSGRSRAGSNLNINKFQWKKVSELDSDAPHPTTIVAAYDHNRA